MSISPAASSENGHVSVAVSDGIATVSFAHPKSNSLPGSLLRQLAEEVDAVGNDTEVRVVVLRSEGLGPFCAGASFDELRSIDDAESGQEFFMGFANLILAMRRCPRLILARVHGKAVGGGVGVAAASDYALATAAASIKLSELAVGIGPFVVGPAIERKIGAGAFGALAIDADWRDAAWAERHGLYASVHHSAEEMDLALEALVKRLAASNPEATTRLKRVLWEGTSDWERLLPKRAAMSGTLVLSDFTRRAISSFQSR